MEAQKLWKGGFKNMENKMNKLANEIIVFLTSKKDKFTFSLDCPDFKPIIDYVTNHLDDDYSLISIEGAKPEFDEKAFIDSLKGCIFDFLEKIINNKKLYDQAIKELEDPFSAKQSI